MAPSLSIAENLLLGRLPGSAWRCNWETAVTKSREALQRVGLTINPMTPLEQLGVGQRQLVEVARVVAIQPRILLLDEPTAALGDREALHLMSVVRALCREGIACIYISHRLDEVFEIADRISVLRDGCLVSTSAAAAATEQQVIRDMVGRELNDFFPPRRSRRRVGVKLRVRNLSTPPLRGTPLHNVDLDAFGGEILGLGGLMGAGRTELLTQIYGFGAAAASGDVELNGASYRRRSPSQSLRRGLMLVCEDRKQHGIFPNLSIDENLSLSSLGRVSRRGQIDRFAEHRRNNAVLESLRFRALNSVSQASQLSGGNQQKMVLGRGLLIDPEIVLLDEPTRGVDVGAKREIYQTLHQLAARGAAVVMASSELAELLGVCDRIAMMSNGRITGVYSAADCSQETLISAALKS